MLDSVSRVYSEHFKEIHKLHMDNCFLKELTNSIEIDLTSESFQHSFKRSLLTDMKIRVGLIYKRAEYAAGDAIQEQNLKLWVPLDLTNDFIECTYVYPLSAHGSIVKILCPLFLLAEKG